MNIELGSNITNAKRLSSSNDNHFSDTRTKKQKKTKFNFLNMPFSSNRQYGDSEEKFVSCECRWNFN